MNSTVSYEKLPTTASASRVLFELGSAGNSILGQLRALPLKSRLRGQFEPLNDRKDQRVAMEDRSFSLDIRARPLGLTLAAEINRQTELEFRGSRRRLV